LACTRVQLIKSERCWARGTINLSQPVGATPPFSLLMALLRAGRRWPKRLRARQTWIRAEACGEGQEISFRLKRAEACFTLGRPSKLLTSAGKVRQAFWIRDGACTPSRRTFYADGVIWAIGRAPSETSISWPLINCGAPRQAADTLSYRVAPLHFCHSFYVGFRAYGLSKTLGGRVELSHLSTIDSE
jgi:hypothetical protein